MMTTYRHPPKFGYNFGVEEASNEVGIVNLASAHVNGSVECTNSYCVDDDEYLDMIRAYIFPTNYEWVLNCFYIATFIVGLVGNFLVSLAVWPNHSMRTVTNYFIANLSVADILVLLICLPPTVLDDVTDTWYMGSVMCRMVKYLQLGLWTMAQRQQVMNYIWQYGVLTSYWWVMYIYMYTYRESLLSKWQQNRNYPQHKVNILSLDFKIHPWSIQRISQSNILGVVYDYCWRWKPNV